MSTETALEGQKAAVASSEAPLPAVRVTDDLTWALVQMRAGERITINEALIARFKQKPRDEWVKAMVAKGIPAGPILDVDEVLKDAQLAARQAFETADGIQFPRFPVRINGLDQVSLGPAKALGADTAALVGEKAKA